MTVRWRWTLLLALSLALATPLTTVAGSDLAASAALQPCMAGAVYDPACDVDHDGDVDIFDIQLTAGHWNRNDVWTGGDYWSLLGNAATNPAVNFVGTSDNQPLVVRTNNAERLRVTTSGQVGIGLANPTDQLSVRNTGAGRAGFFQTDNGANNAPRCRPWYRTATAARCSPTSWTGPIARPAFMRRRKEPVRPRVSRA